MGPGKQSASFSSIKPSASVIDGCRALPFTGNFLLNISRSPNLAPNATSYPERCQMAVSGSGIKMCYLSPFMGGSGAADSRTISESNLSTSGYSSISSPGLSRCNSSSPMLADEMNIGAFQRAGQGHLQVTASVSPPSFHRFVIFNDSATEDDWSPRRERERERVIQYGFIRHSRFHADLCIAGESYPCAPQGLSPPRATIQQLPNSPNK